MRIPDDKIEEIRSATDIVDLISGYIPLKKRGKNYTGLCPFHHEKTPSFSVSAEKQMYYCFGCSAGGNVFTFVMEHDKVSFVEAVRTLAARAGIVVPEEQSPEQATEYEELFDACRKASLFFQETLLRSLEGKLTLEYFRHRGFTDDTIRRFGLGYSPNGWDGLLKFAEKEGMPLPVLVRAGLALQREDGTGHYDRFRGRAMFPILSSSGRVIAFGARKMRDDDPLGKYINSPETPIYSKSRTLYGLFHAKEAIRNRGFAVLVEGYADLISVFQAGTLNVVASSGTALTEEQIQMIGRFARDITLVYDADSAGSKATVRGVDLVIEQGLDVRVASLPPGEDPDSFVKRNGGKAFEDLLAGAVSFLDFKVELFRQVGSFQTPEGKTRAVRSIVETLARMKDELKRNFYVKALAEKYDIYETILFREIERQLGQRRTPAPAAGQQTSRVSPEGAARVMIQPQDELPAPERDLLKVMLEHGPPMMEYVLSSVRPGSFRHPLARELAAQLLPLADRKESWDPNLFLDQQVNPAMRKLVANLVMGRPELSAGWARLGSGFGTPEPWQVARTAIRLIAIREIDDLIHEQHRLLKEAQVRGETTQPYHQQILALQAERKELVAARDTPPAENP